MARRSASEAFKLLSRVRSGRRPKGKGTRLVEALKAAVKRKALTPSQHVLVKDYWRETARTRDKSAKEIRGTIRKYLSRLSSKARGSRDPQVQRMRQVQHDVSELGVPPENVKVYVREKGYRGVRRYSISSLARFLTLPVYKSRREKVKEMTANLAVQDEVGDEGEVLATINL